MSEASASGSDVIDLDTGETCRCGREPIINTRWCCSRCYEAAVEAGEVEGDLPCSNDHWWCPGPEGPTEEGAPFGGKCMECTISEGTPPSGLETDQEEPADE